MAIERRIAFRNAKGYEFPGLAVDSLVGSAGLRAALALTEDLRLSDLAGSPLAGARLRLRDELRQRGLLR